MISSGFLGHGDLVEERQQVGEVGDLLLVDQDVRVFETHSALLGSVMK
jgi:hypothetical protein